MSDFYPAFSATCFVVLTLWLATVAVRHSDWKGEEDLEKRAFSVGLFFSLPGIMTLISLVNPTSPRLWELSYMIVALVGAAVIAVLFNAGRDRVMTAAYALAIALYLAIGVIAIVAITQPVAHVENQIDQVLLCVLLFLGVNVAWWLIFADSNAETKKSGAAGGAAAGSQAAAADQLVGGRDLDRGSG
jgi:Sec-independent protein secretion pathway component TatC